jgi:small nuclear ribonucleoprotein (snRNP)-like protein
MDKENKGKIKVDQEEKKPIPKRILQDNRIKKLEEELRKARERKKEYVSNDSLKLWKKIKPLILRDERILISFLENEELFQGLLKQIEEYINKHISLANEEEEKKEGKEDDTTTGEYN